MLSRLKPVLSVLLALVVCGASSQAAVCELSCGLDAREGACHMATASHVPTMQGMAPGHCASDSSMQAQEMDQGTSVCNLHEIGCGHSFSPVVESSVASKLRLGVAQWSFSQSAAVERFVLRSAALPRRRPPPLLASAHTLLVTLRI